jgi:hypothetical protein
MWLGYLPNARIIGLDKPDISGLAEDRFTVLCCYLNTGAVSLPHPGMAAALTALRPGSSQCFVFQAHFRKTRAGHVAVIHMRRAAQAGRAPSSIQAFSSSPLSKVIASTGITASIVWIMLSALSGAPTTT